MKEEEEEFSRNQETRSSAGLMEKKIIGLYLVDAEVP